MNPSAKKALFIAVSNLLGLALLFCAAEFIVRWRNEHGFKAAWRSLFSGSTPFSDLSTKDELIPDPDLGYRFNPALPGVNSLGIRHAEIPQTKPPGIRRVIVLGDSVAMPPDGFVGLLRARLRDRAEVINASVPGYTTYQERRLLERDLLATGPDLVILQYCLNDNHRFLHRFDAQEKMLFTEEARRVLLPQGGGLLWRLARHSYLAFRLRLALLQFRGWSAAYPWEDQPDVAAAWQDQSWKEFEEHLGAMRAALGRIGGRLAVLMAPYRPQFEKALLARDSSYVLKPQKKMAEICSRLGVPLLDLYPVLAPKGGRQLFYDHYHFTAPGHQVVAEALYSFLLRKGLIPGP